MTLKTLFLGSAAAFAVVGGAQAADLSVAEPVESVKVCDAFAGGYWYIPGTDTCLKIGGNVEFDVNLHSNSMTDPSTHSSSWDFVTKIGLSFDAKSVIDIGTLEGHVALAGSYDGKGGNSISLDGAWLKIGALQAGHFGSPFNPGSGFVDYDVYNSDLADANKLQLAWTAAGFGLALGIEDPRETWHSSLPASFSMPLITGNITASSGSVAGFLSGGFVQLNGGTTWGVAGKLDIGIGANDKLRLIGAYGGGKFVGGGNDLSNNGWSAIASFQHMFSSKLTFDVDYSYLQPSGGGTTSWIAAADLVWTPYSGFSAKLRGDYTVAGTATGVWKGQVVLKRSW
ncbi:MAG TPA: porin [Pirellulales bacterium]|nr:porin [Pirellulales bacterium]